VHRVDLAQAVDRLLTRIKADDPQRLAAWSSARVKFPDLAPSHLAYPAALISVAAGVMSVAPDGSFQPSKIVTGEEAEAAIARVAAIAGPAVKTAR